VWVPGGRDLVGKVAKRTNRASAHLKKKDFLEALRTTGLVTDACKIAGIGRRTPYDWAQKSEEFAEAMEAARAEGEMVLLDEVRKEARRRGIEGWEEPLVYQGRLTGDTVRKWSDNLLMYWGKYLDPRFRDNYPALDLRFQGPTSVSIILDTTPKSSRPAIEDGSDGSPEQPEEHPPAIETTVEDLGEA